MNKYKKIATAVVATVMAGTIVASVAGCRHDNGPTTKTTFTDPASVVTYVNNKAPQFQAIYNSAWGALVKYYDAHIANNSSGTGTGSYGEGLTPTLVDGKLSWSSNTAIRANLGYSSDTTGIAYHATGELPMSSGSTAANSITLPSGQSYQKGELKPNFATIQENLGVTINNVYTGKGTGDQMTESKTQGFQNYDLIVANVSNITTEAAQGNILDLSLYLDLMPNYKNYLNSGAIMQMSLLGNINTDANTASMYYAPYFDGYDDVERFAIARQDYVTELLDYADLANATTISYAKQASDKAGIGYDTTYKYVGTEASIEPYMGTTGSWTVATADPSDSTKVGYAKVNYGAVITALGDSTSNLYKAVVAGLPSGKTPQKTSGNIVDIQNQMINETKGEVTGAQLLAVLREYIKVAYEWSATESGSYVKLYGNTVNGAETKLSDVFNSEFAAWDVDLLAGIFRCYVTCGDLLGTYQSGEHAKYLFGFSPRAASTNRSCDVWRFVAQLYGVRGLESKLGYSYIDASGNLRDARFNAATWEALENFSAFYKEGLVASANSQNANDYYATNGSASTSSYYDGQNHFQQLFTFDYAQTQTAPAYVFDGVANEKTGNYLYSASDKSGTLGTDYFVETTDGYFYAPVITPVSKWYVDDTSTSNIAGGITHNYTSLSQNDEIMRFTESWRTVKTAGICVPVDGVKNNPDRLAATLAFIDYLYSNDGQIINTFGPMANDNSISGDETNGFTSNCGGFWYGTPVTAAELGVSGDVNDMAAMAAAGVVETYDGKQYTITEEYQSKAFVFGNKLYKGTLYNGEQMPILTDALIQSFYGYKVNGYTANSSAVGSYTSYSQMIIGTNLGFGEKFQCFEYQLTSGQGLEGERVVSTAVGNGTLKHVSFSIDKDNWWYTICPSGAPLSSTNTTEVNSYAEFSKLFTTGSSNYSTMLLLVGYFGLGENGFAVTMIDTSYTVD